MVDDTDDEGESINTYTYTVETSTETRLTSFVNVADKSQSRKPIYSDRSITSSLYVRRYTTRPSESLNYGGTLGLWLRHAPSPRLVPCILLHVISHPPPGLEITLRALFPLQ